MICRICGNETDNKEYAAKEMMYGYRDTHQYFQCSKCGCLQIESIPASMSKYYDASYYSYQPKQNKSDIKRLFIRLRDQYALFRTGLFGKILYTKSPTEKYNFLQPILASLSKDSGILDVGCGAGHLLQSLHELGFNNLRGVDAYIDSDIDYGNGVPIKKQSIHEVQGSYALIMFHHSFEHVPDPMETLQSAFNLLAPGGYCVIRIPIVSSYAWEYYGVHWVQLDAPRHFFLHSTESMKILSNKAGFELCDIIYDSTAFQFWGSEQYIKDIPLKDDRSYGMNPQHSIFSKKDIALFANRADGLNAGGQGDQAIFYLRKSDA